MIKHLLVAFLLASPFVASAATEVIISIPEHRLYVIDDEDIVAQFPVATGKKGTPTPTGEYRISEIVKDPTWHVPESIRNEKGGPKVKEVPPGPTNPLGAYFIRLGDTSIGIHGTIKPKSIGSSVSHGCIRMHNKHVSKVAQLVQRGTVVTITDERVMED